MKKYYMSFVDFSEIVYVTADEEQLLQAKDRMTKLGLLTEKGNPSTSEISSATEHISAPFLQNCKNGLHGARAALLLYGIQ